MSDSVMSPQNQLKLVIEAALFAAQEPLSVFDIKRLFDSDIPADKIRKAVAAVKADWSDRGIELGIAVDRFYMHG